MLAVFTLFGVVHSVGPNGEVYWPWDIHSPLPWAIAARAPT